MTITSDAYKHDVAFSTDGTTDTYVVGGAFTYNFPAGTSDGVVAVTLAIQANLMIFNNALTEFVNTHYSNESRLRWVILYLECQAFSRPNRATYIAQLLSWGDAISVYTSAYIAALMAMQNPAAIAAKTFDQTAIPADPAINLLTCMQIVG